ncbi:MAG TPA: N-acetylmuramoyl-L-alanine amidase, partial [Armatimonadota bacterium]
EHQILDQIHVEQKDSTTVRIALDLKRIAGFATRWDEALCKFFITLELPKGAGGLLSQKIIVIDPGHGGKDQGAQGSGALEKDCNLPIALRVQKLLLQSGACAVLTRESDDYIPLSQRVDSATRHSADLFVSIHCNSCPVPDSISGIETYFHADDMNGRALAQSIHAEVLRASGLPDRRVRSDTTLHKIGLAVLRGTSAVGIPSTLVEVGFLNSSSDGCMIVTPEYQENVAKAIVNGLKQYIEGSSD